MLFDKCYFIENCYLTKFPTYVLQSGIEKLLRIKIIIIIVIFKKIFKGKMFESFSLHCFRAWKHIFILLSHMEQWKLQSDKDYLHHKSICKNK